MSRAFSTSAKHLKQLKWKLNGTTEPVDWAKKSVEAAIDHVPGLAEVDAGVVNGNPHATPSRNDPLHVSGVVGVKDVEGKDRYTSFHAYKDGLVKFSKKIYGEVKGQPTEDSSK